MRLPCDKKGMLIMYVNAEFKIKTIAITREPVESNKNRKSWFVRLEDGTVGQAFENEMTPLLPEPLPEAEQFLSPSEARNLHIAEINEYLGSGLRKTFS